MVQGLRVAGFLVDHAQAVPQVAEERPCRLTWRQHVERPLIGRAGTPQVCRVAEFGVPVEEVVTVLGQVVRIGPRDAAAGHRSRQPGACGDRGRMPPWRAGAAGVAAQRDVNDPCMRLAYRRVYGQVSLMTGRLAAGGRPGCRSQLRASWFHRETAVS